MQKLRLESEPKAYVSLTGKIVGYNRTFQRLIEMEDKELNSANITDLARHKTPSDALESNYQLDQVASSKRGSWKAELLTSHPQATPRIVGADSKDTVDTMNEPDRLEIITTYSDMIIDGSEVMEATIRAKDAPPSSRRMSLSFASNKRDFKSSTRDLIQMPQGELDVLIVDDSDTQLKMMAHMVSDWGHHVETAADGVQALKILQNKSFDIVLMDVNMPHMNGLQAAHEFREIEQYRRATTGDKRYQKIVALSADVNNTIFMECTNAGIDVFIPKPLTRDKFVEVVARQVSL